MEKPKVYVETTVPSFYHNERSEPEMVARRAWTRAWWARALHQAELTTSVAVVDELGRAPPDRAGPRLEQIRSLRLLEILPAVGEIAAVYIARKLMPADVAGDALHLAIASYHRCDFLVTWNCRHLANANKFAHFRRLNAELGLFVPMLVTPLELLEDYDDAP